MRLGHAGNMPCRELGTGVNTPSGQDSQFLPRRAPVFWLYFLGSSFLAPVPGLQFLGPLALAPFPQTPWPRLPALAPWPGAPFWGPGAPFWGQTSKWNLPRQGPDQGKGAKVRPPRRKSGLGNPFWFEIFAGDFCGGLWRGALLGAFAVIPPPRCLVFSRVVWRGLKIVLLWKKLRNSWM